MSTVSTLSVGQARDLVVEGVSILKAEDGYRTDVEARELVCFIRVNMDIAGMTCSDIDMTADELVSFISKYEEAIQDAP